MKDLPTGPSGAPGLRAPNPVELDNEVECDTAIKREWKIVLEMEQTLDSVTLILVKVIVRPHM